MGLLTKSIRKIIFFSSPLNFHFFFCYSCNIRVFIRLQDFYLFFRTFFFIEDNLILRYLERFIINLIWKIPQIIASDPAAMWWNILYIYDVTLASYGYDTAETFCS